jgi:glycosyltransferase involved in cell wall biosynthesis
MLDIPKISIITICKNAESIIAETVKGVLGQTFANIEYIIVDGKSIDRTLDIIHDIVKEYPLRQVKIVSEADEGIADAMNKGILLAGGDVVTHLHAGDRYINNLVIEKVMESYRQNAWRWGVAGSIVVDDIGNEGHIFKANPDYNILLKKNCIPHQSTFLVSDIFKKHGLFKTEYKQAMDYEYWLRIVFKGGERYQVLPFPTTYFLEGGRSSQIYELIKYLSILRREVHSYVDGLTWLDDAIFLGRVLAFAAYTSLQSSLKRIMAVISYW